MLKEPADIRAEEVDPADTALATKIRGRVQSDKDAREKTFASMKTDAYVARHGAPQNWPKNAYRSNFIGRHIANKTAALYAKDPSIRVKKVERLNYSVWDENPQSLMMAFQIVQEGDQIASMTGMMTPEGQMLTPPMPQGYDQAKVLVDDFMQGNARDVALKRMSRTLELLIQHYMREASPLAMKDAAKDCVRRACTTKVAYAALGYRHNTIEDTTVSQDISDVSRRMETIARLSVAEGDEEGLERETALAYAALAEAKSVVVNEGLEITYPESHRVIPDRNCRKLVGFVGARWVTIEHPYTPEQLEATFGKTVSSSTYTEDRTSEKTDSVLVWEHFDKETGLVYLVCDGVDGFLAEPAPLGFEVEGFFPIFALTFNAVEDPDDCYPPSDVEQMLPMQDAHNEAREGQRIHRDAAKPRYITSRGLLTDDDKQALANLGPHETLELDVPPGTPIGQVIQGVPVSGVDPNLYQTSEIYRDMSLAGGTSEAAMGGAGRSTATEAELSAAAQQTSIGSNVDDMDSFLSRVFKAAGQIVMTCMGAEKVKEIVGPGAVWPEQGDADLAREIYLDVVGGSSGRPNQAADIANWARMAPLLAQIPGVDPTALAKELIRRLDDKLDVNELVTPGILSIVAQNAIRPQQQMMGGEPGGGDGQDTGQLPAPTEDPSASPMAQGQEGANMGEREPSAPSGTAFSMGEY